MAGSHLSYPGVSRRISRWQSSYTFSKVIHDNSNYTSVVVGGGDDQKVARRGGRENGLAEWVSGTVCALRGSGTLAYAKSITNRPIRAALSGFQLSPIVTLQSGRFLSPTIGGNGYPKRRRHAQRPIAFRRPKAFEAPGYATFDCG